MEWPYQFPHPADAIAEEAARFRKLSPTERVRKVLGLAALAHRLLRVSPRREAVTALIAKSEEDWRQAHRKVFEQHGC